MKEKKVFIKYALRTGMGGRVSWERAVDGLYSPSDEYGRLWPHNKAR